MTSRGLPAPRSDAVARSRNMRQYTQRLSIQREGGCRIAGRCRRACDSSFFADLPLGRMLRNHFYGSEVRRSVSAPFGTKETGADLAVLSPSSGFGGKGTDTPAAGFGQSPGAWPPVPINSAGLLVCPTRSGVLGAQGWGSATDGGMTFLARPVRLPGCLRPGPKHFCIEATRRSGSKTVWFLSMK